MRSLWSKHLSDVLNILWLSHETSGYDVDSPFESKVINVILIIISENWQVYIAARQVHVLLIAQSVVVLDDYSH